MERTIASGSAIVDVDNVSGFGPDTVLGAYTDYWIRGYKGRPTYGVHGQMVGYSTDGGYSFKPIADQPVIPIEPGSGWRDPKILRTEPGSLCIGVYETYEGKNCVSFYSSTDCRNWTFRSRAMDLFECPDLFPLPVVETGEQLWVLYGASGQYQVGKFENYVFTPLQADKATENGGYLDYGNATYAGQTWNNHPDKTCRYHISWIRDADACRHWCYAPAYNYGLPFCQSMSVQCKLTLHKTARGYRLFREPTAAFAALRRTGRNAPVVFADENGTRGARIALPLVGDCELTFTADKPYTVKMGDDCGFTYTPADRTVNFIGGKSCVLDGDTVSLRVITDIRTVEFFVNGEISATYMNGDCIKALTVIGEDVSGVGTRYILNSIWNT